MQAITSSFRDPSGYMFLHEGEYYRAIHSIYKPHYEHLMQSGLYDNLIQKKLLIQHTETNEFPIEKEMIGILRPQQIPLISYAYEWSFSMLQDAAICTLNNAIEALKYGMIVKDANTYNIQFINGSPILIDTLSFEKYPENEAWVAYRQFCEHFVAPLVLMRYCNASLNKLLLAYPNGIPLDVCQSMLPFKARFNMHVYLHIFLQTKITSKSQAKQNTNTQSASHKSSFSKQKLETLLEGLKSFIGSLHLKKDKTTWDNYYDETILSKEYLNTKKELVTSYLEQVPFHTLLDLGANEGEFSFLYKNTEKQIIALDEDRNCIEKLYSICKRDAIKNVIPLICDLSSPTPDIGWNTDERTALFKRVKPDITLSLALIHHLAIGNNIPLEKIMSFFSPLSPYLIIEFVPKEDPKVKQLLANRKDIFDRYTLEDFKRSANHYYEFIRETAIPNTFRTLFLLKRK